MRVSTLRIAPVKALATVLADVVHLDRDGVSEDRRLYLVDRSGAVVTLRQHPVLAQVVPALDLDAGTLTLTAPGGATVTSGLEPTGQVVVSRLFGKDRCGRVVPGPAAEALSDLAGEPLRLVLAEGTGIGWDEGPVSLVATSTIAAVAPPVDGDPPARFRMLLEVGGAEAFAEDGWVGHRLRVGNAALTVTHALHRCTVINHSPTTGARDWAGLHALRAVRGPQRMTLGVIAAVAEPGAVRLGDTVRPQA